MLSFNAFMHDMPNQTMALNSPNILVWLLKGKILARWGLLWSILPCTEMGMLGCPQTRISTALTIHSNSRASTCAYMRIMCTPNSSLINILPIGSARMNCIYFQCLFKPKLGFTCSNRPMQPCTPTQKITRKWQWCCAWGNGSKFWSILSGCLRNIAYHMLYSY